MKRGTTGTLSMILVLATVFISSGVAMAQGFGPRGGGSLLPRQRVLENLTGITEEQLSQINALGEEFKAAFGSFREERRNLHELLEAELKSETPDPTVVGNLVISQRDFAQQLRTTQEDFRVAFQGMLTVEQQEELEEMRNSRRHGRRGSRRGFRGDREGPLEVL